MRRALASLLDPGRGRVPAAVPSSGLLPPVGDRAAGTPRSRRDWVVDVVSTIVAVLGGGLLWTQEALGDHASHIPPRSAELLVADVATGVLVVGLLWVRRRWPTGTALVAVASTAYSSSAAAAATIVLLGVAIHRPAGLAIALNAATIPLTFVYDALHPDDLPLWVVPSFATVAAAAIVAWGMVIRARRQLVLSLGERAERAEAERELHGERARHAERTRIAREMLDVLAHRLSLLSLHAGALEFRPDAPPEDVARAAGVIRTSAREALDELRAAIGVLRETDAPPPPQPTLADLPALVAECRAAGVHLETDLAAADPAAMPTAASRSAYRIVQEGLTNARKHAPDCAVTVAARGGPGDGLVLEIVNRLPIRVAAAGQATVAGAGSGLIGLEERVEMLGGRLDVGHDGDAYRLRAELPWPVAP